MEVCCLKMASRCRSLRTVQTDISQIPMTSSSHDCGSLSRVVMVRKTDQRMINHKKPEADPKCEFITLETIQTYKGHKPDRTVVYTEKHDMVESEAQKSPGAQRFLTRTPDTVDAGNDGANKRIIKDGSKTLTPRSTVRRTHSLMAKRSASTSTYSDFETSCLKAHNEFRARHGVPPLKLSRKLSRFSDEWAKVIAARGTATHRNQSPYGENIFCCWSSIPNMKVNGWEPVENWYSEGVNHFFGKEPSTLKTGHFTQIVWRDSRELGVGMAKNRSGQIFVVANYDPPGNFIGSFSENVPPIGGFDDKTIERMSHVSFESYLDPGKDDNLDAQIFVEGMLRVHNEYRRKHGVPELSMNKTLCNLSQEWAETLAAEDRFAHRPNSNYGENIYCLWSSDRNSKMSPKAVCRSWYEEIKEHEFGVEPKGIFKGGHFTQMIWKSSQDLGVGISRTKKGKILVVCNYSPRGNIAGQFNANVLRAR